MNAIPIEPLTAGAFQPFGDVIETDNREFFLINNGSTQRYDRLAQVETGAEGQAVISIFRAQRLDYPLSIKMVERHPLGSQAFIPLNQKPFLVVVAPKGEQVEPSSIRAFITNGQQGVNYHAGVWHHPILSLEQEDDFLVVDRVGAGNNCDEFFFEADQIKVLNPEF